MSDLNPLERKTVLMLMLGMDRSLESLPVIATAIGGVERAVGKANANLLVANLPEADRVPDVLRRRRIDGLILKGALQGDLIGSANPELIKILKGLPTVWILGRPRGAWGDVVHVNDATIGQIAAEHLLASGHRRLAFVCPKPSHAVLLRRQAGFTFFAEQGGAVVTPSLGDDGRWSFPLRATNEVEMVQGLVDRLLGMNERPTAIFAPDDSIGAMTVRALSVRGMQVGRDMSLMSCNNERPLLMGIHPSMTTIDIHAERIGGLAVDHLAFRLTHCDAPAVEIDVEPTLVRGESVVPPVSRGATAGSAD